MPTIDHPDWAAFLRAIVAAPDDDTPRLVAADWLDEHGDPDRAAFIRIQVELARLEAAGLGKSLEVDALRKKERAYLGPASYFRPLWAAEACPELVRVMVGEGAAHPLAAMHVDGAERLTFRRGFVERVRCPASDWLQHGVVVLARQPIRCVGLTHCLDMGMDRWWAMLSALRGLDTVFLVGAWHPPGGQLFAWLRTQLPGVRVAAVDTTAGDFLVEPRSGDRR